MQKIQKEGSSALTAVTAYHFMDAIRAVAAIEVLVSHVRDLNFVDALPRMRSAFAAFYILTGFGHQSVMIFFVLSGYWISRSVIARDEQGRWSWSQYLIDRTTRLWIVLIPALIIGGTLDVVGRYILAAPLYMGSQGAHSITSDVAASLNLKTAFGNALFLQTLLVPPLGSNGPLWSLCNEFWYYILFPSLYLFARRRKVSTLAGIAALLVIAVFPKLLPGFACWLVGTAVFVFSRRCEKVQPKFRARAKIAFPVTLLLFAGALLISKASKVTFALTDLAVSFSFGIVLITLIFAQFRYPISIKAISRYGADSSYSLYVIHFPLVALVSASFTAPQHREFPSMSIFVGFGLESLLAIVFGYAFSKLTEANTAKFRVWLRTQTARCFSD